MDMRPVGTALRSVQNGTVHDLCLQERGANDAYRSYRNVADPWSTVSCF